MSSGYMQAAGVGSGIAEQATTAAYNKAESKKGRNYNEAVMKNKVRWMVNDMKRAGINPLTAFMGSGGFSGGATLSAPTASMSGGSGSASAKQFSEAFRAEKQGERESAEAAAKRIMPDVMNAQIEQLKTEAMKNRDQGGLFWQQRNESAQRAEYWKAMERSENFNATLRGLEIPGARNRANVEATKVGQGAAWVDKILKTSQPVLNLLR